jgi:hypothetical protein
MNVATFGCIFKCCCNITHIEWEKLFARPEKENTGQKRRVVNREEGERQKRAVNPRRDGGDRRLFASDVTAS